VSDREIDTMNTSSIDLICCALGGVLLIMLLVATLERAKAERAALAADKGASDKGNQAAGLEGLRDAPPSLLVAELQWDKPARYPPQLLGYPPVWAGTGPKPREPAKLDNNAALTASRGLVRVAEGGPFYGFFDRKPGRGTQGSKVELVVPRGSRHALLWRFKVFYPNNATAVPISGTDPVRSLRDAIAEMKAWAKQAGGSWQDGPTPPPKKERNERVDELCRVAVLPILKRFTTQPPTEAKAHDWALQLVRAVDQILETTQARRDDISWANDLLSDKGPVEKAQTGGAAWLARVYDYATAFAGTDPNSPGKIEVGVMLKAYLPRPIGSVEQTLSVLEGPDLGKVKAILEPGGSAVFGLVK
jgi:hypothetical protein